MDETVVHILKAFSDNKLFTEGVELIGSWCFKLYQKHLGAGNFPLATLDIDFLIPVPYHGKENPDFIRQLQALGFKRDFKSDGSLYLWNAELKIEFIAPERGRGADNAINIKKLGLRAIPLRFVNLLLANPITLTDQGLKIRVPSPASFCLHKILIAARRRQADKRLKDLQQAVYTAAIVPGPELSGLFKSLPKPWQQTINQALIKAKAQLPLLGKEIAKIMAALQTGK